METAILASLPEEEAKVPKAKIQQPEQAGISDPEGKFFINSVSDFVQYLYIDCL